MSEETVTLHVTLPLAEAEGLARCYQKRVRRRPGQVRDAIELALRQAEAPLRVKEIHAAVVVQLGDVPESSVRSHLNLNCKVGQTFERTKRGFYRLR